MDMRPSVVLNKLRAGGLASCVKINTADPRVVELAALCGFDCVWTDMEHVGNSYADIERQILAAKAHNTDCLVRVAKGGYSNLIRPLELDATGIMVPHLMGPEEARKLAKTTRFHPVGMRPLDGGNADAAYCMTPLDEYLRQANAQRFVVVQIEDPEPLDELDAICGVEGIDMLFFGPGDFSHAIGDPGNFENPRLMEARRLVAETARRHGKFAGTVGGMADIAGLYTLGYRFISVGADVVGLSGYFSQITATFDAFRPE